MKTLTLLEALVVLAAMLTVGCSAPQSTNSSGVLENSNSTQLDGRVSESSFVTIDGIRLDPRLKPVYTYVKAVQTGNLELFKDSCSAHIRKYLLTDIRRKFENIRKQFSTQYGNANAKDFSFEYKEQEPFGLACYKHLGRGGGFL